MPCCRVAALDDTKNGKYFYVSQPGAGELHVEQCDCLFLATLQHCGHSREQSVGLISESEIKFSLSVQLYQLR